MKTEIITIGDELLIGQVVDTNSAWLSKTLNQINLSVTKITTIHDTAEAIIEQLSISLRDSDLVIITGGLGPTKDDVTKKTLAEFFDSGWRTDESVIEQLESFFKSRGRTLLEINRLQANLPANCITLQNEWGTAPGMWFDIDGKILISMPGVPYEMKKIFEFKAIPKLVQRFNEAPIYHKTLLTYNVPESMIAKRIEHIEDNLPGYIKLAYLPNQNLVRLRLSGIQSGLDIVNEINEYISQIKEILGDAVVADDDITLPELSFQLLEASGKTLSLAESCSGGFLTHSLTLLPGISKVFVGSVVSYSNSVKHHQLGVDNTHFETVGAVSEQVVTEMVEGVREKLTTDYSIAISGIAGPGGGSEDKPVGTVVIGVASDKQTIVERFHFSGDRMSIISRAANTAFTQLIRLVRSENQA